jgi:hypothetical protein
MCGLINSRIVHHEALSFSVRTTPPRRTPIHLHTARTRTTQTVGSDVSLDGIASHIPRAARRSPYSLYIDRNELHVAINGAWTTPSPHARPRFLLPKPTGFIFGSFDGHPIILDEITVEQHLLRSESAWSIKM